MQTHSHLSVLLDLSPVEWHHAEQFSLQAFLSQLLVFLNAHIALSDENTLAVWGALPGNSPMLYSSIDPPTELSSVDSNSYPPFRRLDAAVVTQIACHLDDNDDNNNDDNDDNNNDDNPPSALVPALTKALCYINRLSAPSDPRILILSVSPDLPTAHIPIMNSIFSAQKLKITIDACQILGPDTVFLQQAAHLTGGSYLHLDRPDALLQYLIMAFLPPPSIRNILAVPTQDKIDFRAACFCHKNIVDIGFVCSVCLSIFCHPVPVCSTCRTKFPIKTLKRLNSVRLPSSDSPISTSARPSPATTPSSSQPLSRPTQNGNGSKH